MTLPATLLTDGSSDRVLLHVLRWLVGQLTETTVEITWADFAGAGGRPPGLGNRIQLAVDLYPCRLLFVHRDSEGQDPQLRYDEVHGANETGEHHVCVVPIRMQEAWLLHDEQALREAADHPSGTESLDLPKPNKWETLADPKDVLHTALRVASGKTGRKAKKFKPDRAAHRLAEIIEDWSPLRTLSAFKQLESDTSHALKKLGVSLRGKKKKTAPRSSVPKKPWDLPEWLNMVPEPRDAESQDPDE